ncbi:MAG: DegT/DnrJ/EryC1/StrS family aminotransferase [Alicyclobacillus sp.]|nr:DegT/DnrJ/EryC1/StrS family aminotransferase [Alicyclobacillus sp.]
MANPVLKARLALFGGTPARPKPAPPMFPGGMFIGKEEEEAVVQVVRSKNLFRYYGPDPHRESTVARFEDEFAKYMGVNYAQAVNSGTSALVSALVGAGVGEGDEVIIPAFAWIATAAAVALVRAIPVVAEVDESLTLDPNSFESRITPRTKAVIPVHMRGKPCDMDPIMEIARRHRLKVVEDTAQACGGRYKGRFLGTIGDVGAFSFQINKVITTGEGGMVVTNDVVTYERARAWHDGARTWGESLHTGTNFPGENYRMPELSGAVGLVQLNKLDMIVSRMRRNKAMLTERTAHLQLRCPNHTDPHGEVAMSFIFFAPSAAQAVDAANALRAENVPSYVLYQEDRRDLHVFAYWDRLLVGTGARCAPELCPRSMEILGKAVHIDVNPLYEEKDIEEIALAVEKVVQGIF